MLNSLHFFLESRRYKIKYMVSYLAYVYKVFQKENISEYK